MDGYLCAGDLVGYGPFPNECVALVAELFALQDGADAPASDSSATGEPAGSGREASEEVEDVASRADVLRLTRRK